MKIVEQYVFDDEDRRLLSIELPDNPCNNCSVGNVGECFGCPDDFKYNEAIRIYKGRNIYDLALKFKRIKRLKREIDKLQNEIEKIEKEINDTGIFS